MKKESKISKRRSKNVGRLTALTPIRIIPPMKGLDGLAAVIQGSQDKMPERKISVTSKVDFHDNSGRYKWLLTKKTGDKSEGLDYFEYNSENRITRIVSFFGVLS